MPGFYEAIVQAGGPLTAAWILEGENAGARALLDSRGLLFRDAAFPAEKTAGIRPEGIAEAGGEKIFTERISRGRRLVICGAGHVSLCVIRLAVMLDFAVTVIEDREEFAAKAREAGAQQVICRPFGDALKEISGDELTAFVIMTREHAHDVECLRRILAKPYAYAGMMGSRSRTGEVRKQLLAEGFDAEKVAGLHMPIGLPIGSRTPEEIAVSVAAELIAEMNAVDPGEGFPPGMAEELAEGAGGVLAMIVEKEGEAPRRPGTKMLVRGNGDFLGTVGGGYAEAVILEAARKMISEGQPGNRLIRVSMKKGTMYCGGEITVFLTRVKGRAKA